MRERSLPSELLSFPTVFALKDTYQIFIPFSREAIVWIRIGNELYYDDANGMLRSGTNIHRVEVPMAELDAAEAYTLCWRCMIERKPYFPTSEEEKELTFPFRPVPKTGEIHIYHVSDAHNLEDPVIRAGSFFGDRLDLLVLNGDIPSPANPPKGCRFHTRCPYAKEICKQICPTYKEYEEGHFAACHLLEGE